MKISEKAKAEAENTAVTLAVADIVPARENVHAREKRNSETMKGLVESVKANGLIHRIVVRRAPDDPGKYLIVDGHRRFEAAKLAGLGEVPCEVRDVEEADALAMTVAANVQRLENDPILEAEAIERMMKAGKGRSEIAAAIGKDEGYVARRQRLCNLTKPWRDLAKRVPCTAHMLERVAAHEQELQNRVAEEVGISDYDPEGDVFEWGEVEDSFYAEQRNLADAAFDTKPCRECSFNTACHQFLFDEMAEDGKTKAFCQRPECYKRRNNETVDKAIAELKRCGTPAIEVAQSWSIPNGWSATATPTKTNTQAYVYEDCGIKRMKWSIPKPKPVRAVTTPEEREAKKAEQRRNKLVSSARDKLRKAIGEDGTDFFSGSESAGMAFDRIAAKRLERDLAGHWIADDLLDDIVDEFGHGREVGDALTADELSAYNEMLAAKRRAADADGADDADGDGESTEEE